MEPDGPPLFKGWLVDDNPSSELIGSTSEVIEVELAKASSMVEIRGSEGHKGDLPWWWDSMMMPTLRKQLERELGYSGAVERRIEVASGAVPACFC